MRVTASSEHAQPTMKRDVLRVALQHNQILRAVIGLVAIHVMNDGGYRQVVPKRLFGDEDVLEDGPAKHRCPWVIRSENQHVAAA